MKVKTLKPHVYAGISRQISDEYDMDEKFLTVMTGLGNVAVAEEDRAFPDTMTTRDLTAGPPPKKYKTRDMRPESKK